MISKALNMLHVAAWIVATVLAFLVVSERDGNAPLPATATITVTSWSGRSAAADLRSELEQYARDKQITVAQEVADFGNRGAVRHLYLVDGDPEVPGADWLSDGMGDFGGAMSTVVHPLRDAADRSPIGAYDVFGDQDKAVALAPFFASHGISYDVTEIGVIGSVPRPVMLTVTVVVLLTISMIGAVVVASTRRYAVARLHGLPYATLLAADLRRFVLRWSVCGLSTLGLASLLLLVRFGGSGMFFFLATAVVIQAVTLAAAVVAHALFLSMVTSVEILSALKGELPAGALTFTAYGLRLVGLIIALGTMATTVALAADVASRDQSRDAFDRLQTLSAITLGNAYTNADQHRLDEVVGPWMRSVDHSRDLLVAAQQRIVSDDPQWRGRTTMLVNDRFLADQPVRLTDGGTFTQPAADKIAVLIPNSSWDARDRLISHLDLPVQLQPSTQAEYTFSRYVAGQHFFTYAPASGPTESVQNWDTTSAYVTDPVIVVLPSARGWLSNSSYVAFASQGGALFPDPQTVSRAVAQNPELERFVRGVTPVADKAAAALTEQTAQLRMAVFTALLACVVVAASGMAAATIQTRRIAQRAFVRHLFGWSFPAIYRVSLIVECLVLTALILWIPWRLGVQRRELEVWQAVGGPLPVDLPSVDIGQGSALAILAAVTAGSYLAALVYGHRRVVHGGASEA